MRFRPMLPVRLQTKLLIILAVPFVVCLVEMAIFVRSRQIAVEGYQEAIAWSHHAIRGENQGDRGALPAGDPRAGPGPER